VDIIALRAEVADSDIVLPALLDARDLARERPDRERVGHAGAEHVENPSPDDRKSAVAIGGGEQELRPLDRAVLGRRLERRRFGHHGAARSGDAVFAGRAGDDDPDAARVGQRQDRFQQAARRVQMRAPERLPSRPADALAGEMEYVRRPYTADNGRRLVDIPQIAADRARARKPRQPKKRGARMALAKMG